MKISTSRTTVGIILAVLLILLTVERASTQHRDAGQMVVPIGHEDEDSIRFHLFNMTSVRDQPYDPEPGAAYIDSVADEFHVNFEGSWGGLSPSVIGGRRKGTMARGAGEAPKNPVFNHETDLGFLSRKVKQRLYHALPDILRYRFSEGFFWRYNDANIAGSGGTVHNEIYDRNDINPYVQYPRNNSFSNQAFLTRRYNLGSDTVSQSKLYGDEGRVILGWSEQRDPNAMMMVIRNLFSQAGEAPKLFSGHLDFNIETHDDSIDQSNKGTRATEDLPLLRVQVLFKEGSKNIQDPGWPTRPMVPFRTTANPGNPGWWLVADQIVTKRMYDTLAPSWRKRDRLEDGSNAQPWEFKQLYLRLDDMPQAMKDLMRSDTTLGAAGMWGNGATDQSKITSFLHPDELGEDDNADMSKKWILEIRILSTYRSTIRVRSLAFQDTIVDKFMYRQKFGSADSTHSCDPLPIGVFKAHQAGGWDDSLAIRVDSLASKADGRPREVLVNDTDPWERGAHDGLLTPFLGVLDQIGAKRNVHVHYREQDNSGGITLHYRRARMSLDGIVPSMYETQYSYYYGNKPLYAYVRDGALVNVNCRGCDQDTFPTVIPHDYVINTLRPPSSMAWPSLGDQMFNTVFARSNMEGDSLRAYKVYTDQRAGMDFQTGAFRNAAKHGLQHPKARRFALETAVQGWWQWRSGAYFDSVNSTWVYSPWRPYFTFRPTTPEEITSHIWVALANGFSTFNIAEPFGLAKGYGGAAGPWGISPRTHHEQPWVLDNRRNWGPLYGLNNVITCIDSALENPKVYFEWVTRIVDGVPTQFWEEMKRPTWTFHGDSSIVSGNLPDWYQGHSNTYRAYKKVFSRINSSYNLTTAAFPITRFEWRDAYSVQKALSPAWRNVGVKQDSMTLAAAFLKVTSTRPVDPWLRGDNGQYIDATEVDSAHRTYVEVGLFRDRLNGTLQPQGYAALVVNTRLWPTLNDSSDHAYFNHGLTRSVDSSRSTLGDIDVRKVFMKIDPTKMHDTMKSTYYVVRDIWHPDTTWLVHKDSSFAVYIKPGDAKFLYIEKAIAIKASPTATTMASSFGFNNGRRIAERENHTRAVVTYVRNDSLFVSYPAIGQTFEGPNERSSGDNLASGFERCIDTLNSMRPSICVARNDTAVAIAYWYRDNPPNQGKVRVAYQRKHGEPWKHATYQMVTFDDNSQDRSTVTPVLTPLDDTTWFVAATYTAGWAANSGIVGFRFTVDATGQPTFKPDGLKWIKEDTGPWGAHLSQFPTVSSRPLPDHMNPVRIAWQKAGKIFEKGLSWSGADPIMTNEIHLTAGLPTHCQNRHPSIALSAYYFRNVTRLPGGDSIVEYLPYILENVVWESRLIGNPGSDGKYWPVFRAGIQQMQNPVQGWFPFMAFRAYDPSEDPSPRYPIVSAEPSVAWRKFMHVIDTGKFLQGAHDHIRILWQNIPTETIEGAHVLDAWYKSSLREDGRHLSQSLTTDSLTLPSDTNMVNRSMVWVARPDEPDRHVRITNGWIPFVNKSSHFAPSFNFLVFIDSQAEGTCPRLIKRTGWENGWIVRPNYERPVVWSTVPPTDLALPHTWPVSSISPAEVHTDSFTVIANDSIVVPRVIDSVDISMLQQMLGAPGDYVMFRMRLLRWRDSSYVATLDSLIVTSTTVHLPGTLTGIDPNHAIMKLPQNQATDTVFIAVDLKRGALNGLSRSLVQFSIDDETIVNYKTATKAAVQNANKAIAVTVHPNPFNPTTLVSISELKGLRTTVELFDQLGKKLQILYDKEPEGEEIHIALDASELPSGSYMVRVVSGREIVTRKIQLVK